MTIVHWMCILGALSLLLATLDHDDGPPEDKEGPWWL